MFFSDNLLLLEMPKAGSTFMRRFLEHYYGKENIRKEGVHNGIKDQRLKDKILTKELIVLNTIRNPFDWYVSMFAWNSMGKGVYRNIGLKRFELSVDGAKTVAKNPAILFRDLSEWKEVFQDPNSPELFQRWLRLLLEEKSHHVERRFGKLREHMGFCTFRFLQLNTYQFFRNYTQLLNATSVEDFYTTNKLPIIFLRTEALTDELLSKASAAGLEEGKVVAALNTMAEKKMMKANSSKRLSYEHYYDEATKKLVYEKDEFLIKLFDYAF